ncbi:hypothetical protein [Nannocystis pusilla]|uniref:hypothetical protein n=1 Tax=Nannocystis pusilla TaxID=889268 RepID=UPI003B7C2227
MKYSEKLERVGRILGSLDYAVEKAGGDWAVQVAREVVALAGVSIGEANKARAAWYTATGAPVPDEGSPFLCTQEPSVPRLDSDVDGLVGPIEQDRRFWSRGERS